MTCKSRSPARPFMRANHNAPSSVMPSPAMVMFAVFVWPSILGQLGVDSSGPQ